MFKITGITLIVIKGSVVQGAECSKITMCSTGIDSFQHFFRTIRTV